MDNRLGALALKIDEEPERDEEVALENLAETEDEEPESPERIGDYDVPSHFFQGVGSTAMLTR
jgi:hypothetical protein